jgi:thymidylate kinase
MMYAVEDTEPIVSNVATADVVQKSDAKVLPIVRELCQRLAAEQISYCHWKSNNALDRSASGENDLDLLVSQEDGPRFEEILRQLDFKQVKAPPEKAMPGVFDYFGYEAEADKFVHVHLHYHLVLGHDSSKNYRLPIEKEYLESAVDGGLFRVPAVEYEFVVFVIRMTLKHLTWDLMIGGEGKLKTSEQRELEYLLARIDQERVYDILTWCLPQVELALFDRCVEALQDRSSTWMRLQAGQQMQAKLQATARRPPLLDLSLKVWRKFAIPLRRRVFKAPSKYRLEGRNSMIALIGGDGAGKTTAVKALHSWLSKYFDTTQVHMGKPAWSRTTTFVRAILKMGHLLGLYPAESSMLETIDQHSPMSPGYPWLSREACLARDRYNTYRRARRFADRGGVAIIDRFPLVHTIRMDGPQAKRFVELLEEKSHGGHFMRPTTRSWLANFLIELEARYYKRIKPPDVLIVLRVDPEIAVQRKTDEDATSVRARSAEIWQATWEHTNAHVVDGSKSADSVLRDLKSFIWSKL